MRGAARIGHAFGMDPVAVLAEQDPFRVAVRSAAVIVVADDQAAMQRAMFGGGD